MKPHLFPVLALATAARAQQACSLTAEKKPALTWSSCTSAGGCTDKTASVVVDANWRWTHSVDGSTNCYTGNTFDATLCPNNAECAANCCVDGADYETTYGITSSGAALTLDFVKGSNVGSRNYLMGDNNQYEMFDLLGKEFSFDVDASNLPCGLNGALYFVAMDADGGTAKYPTNKAGANFGTGYCDSQCAMDLKFINGQGNVEGWTPSKTDKNAGVGGHGSCCVEVDIWEANSVSTANTIHPCTTVGQHQCVAPACSGTYSADRYGGDCDPDGCDFNPYRVGNTKFYGQGMTVDTSKPMTVVTQFLTDAAGNLGEVRRFYVQDKVLIPNAQSQVAGIPGNSLTEAYCKAEATTFSGMTDSFAKLGGWASLTAALKQGLVLVMSVWDDHYSNMQWLDGPAYPPGSTGPGSARGSCPATSGVPADVEASAASSKVIFSNIRFGDINSTYSYTSVAGNGRRAIPFR